MLLSAYCVITSSSAQIRAQCSLYLRSYTYEFYGRMQQLVPDICHGYAIIPSICATQFMPIPYLQGMLQQPNKKRDKKHASSCSPNHQVAMNLIWVSICKRKRKDCQCRTMIILEIVNPLQPAKYRNREWAIGIPRSLDRKKRDELFGSSSFFTLQGS